MKFIRVTVPATGRVIYINAAYVVEVSTKADGTTLIQGPFNHPDCDHYWEVKEPLDQILVALENAS